MTLSSMRRVLPSVLWTDDEASFLENLPQIDRSVRMKRDHEEKILEAKAQLIAPKQGT